MTADKRLAQGSGWSGEHTAASTAETPGSHRMALQRAAPQPDNKPGVLIQELQR